VAILAAALSPLVAAIVARRAFRGIAAPLSDLIAAADRMAEGDLSARVAQVGRGDVARLARSFNHMAEELQRAEEVRRNLTADVAHELRTPLQIIQGNLEGILDDVYEPSDENLLSTLEETRSLGRLVDDLRTLSLAEAGQLRLSMEPLLARELLADVATSFSGQAEVVGVKLTVQVSEEDAGLTFQGDAGRMDEILTNLVANALRYTPRGGSITLGARAIPSGVRLTVADTGEGIPEDDLPHIFDRYWRDDGARGTQGAGLGLAIARQLVQAQGGEIQVHSAVGQGTTFHIDLPRGPIEGIS
jgi:signal transduction histidine kinase